MLLVPRCRIKKTGGKTRWVFPEVPFREEVFRILASHFGCSPFGFEIEFSPTVADGFFVLCIKNGKPLLKVSGLSGAIVGYSVLCQLKRQNPVEISDCEVYPVEKNFRKVGVRVKFMDDFTDSYRRYVYLLFLSAGLVPVGQDEYIPVVPEFGGKVFDLDFIFPELALVNILGERGCWLLYGNRDHLCVEFVKKLFSASSPGLDAAWGFVASNYLWGEEALASAEIVYRLKKAATGKSERAFLEFSRILALLRDKLAWRFKPEVGEFYKRILVKREMLAKKLGVAA